MPAFPALIKGVPHDSNGKPLKPHLEWDTVEGCPVGRDPRNMEPSDLEALGLEGNPLLKVVRMKCLDCVGGAESEVRRCADISCALWAYRMNKNPWHRREITEERRERLREHGRQLGSSRAKNT